MVDDRPVKYVPILKWRRGEKNALKNLDENLKKNIMPIIELVNDEGDNPEDLSNDISLHWLNKRAYLDVYYRPNHFAINALNNVSNHTQGIDIIPVVRLNSPPIVIDGINTVRGMFRNGYAIRVESSEEQDCDLLSKEIELIIKQIPEARKNIDLIVDFGYIEGMKSYTDALDAFFAKVPVSDWRRVVVAGGSFPQTLGEFSPNDDNFIKRSELLFWRKYTKKSGYDLIFSDYTVRYPLNITKGGKGSVSARYTLDDSIQIFRGRRGDAYFKYLAHALNIKTLYGEEFPENYSWGDSFIFEKAAQLEQCLAEGVDPEDYPDFTTGGATEWVIASINHHINVVLKRNLD